MTFLLWTAFVAAHKFWYAASIFSPLRYSSIFPSNFFFKPQLFRALRALRTQVSPNVITFNIHSALLFLTYKTLTLLWDTIMSTQGTGQLVHIINSLFLCFPFWGCFSWFSVWHRIHSCEQHSPHSTCSMRTYDLSLSLFDPLPKRPLLLLPLTFPTLSISIQSSWQLLFSLPYMSHNVQRFWIFLGSASFT